MPVSYNYSAGEPLHQKATKPMAHVKASFLTILLFLALSCHVSAATFRIVQITDSHIRAEGEHCSQLQAVVDEIGTTTPAPDLVISTGDYTDTGDPDQYETYRKIISKLKVPVYNAIGNHEVKWSTWSKVGSEHFLGQKTYYSFNHKGIHFICLDASIWLEHNSAIDPLELKWLKNDLRKTGRKRPIVLFYHHCPNYVTNESAFLDILKPYNVRLALVGHEHTWGAITRNGVNFRTCETSYDGNGIYRIVDFSDTDIKGYRKEVGKEAVADMDIRLSPATNPVHLLSPHADASIGREFQVTATSDLPMDKMEIALDGRYQPASRLADGPYCSSFAGDIVPGHHSISVRGTDPGGDQWLDSVNATIGDAKREAWRFRASGAVYRDVTAKDGRLFFGCTGGDVYCLDAVTGRKIWKTNVGGDVIAGTAVDDGSVFLGNTRGEVVCLSAHTGETLWKTQFVGAVQASPVVVNRVVYTGVGEGRFCALDAKSGKVLWNTPTGAMIQASPLVLGNRIFVGNWNMNLYCLESQTGSIVWKHRVGEWEGYSPACCNPATDGKSIFITSIPMYKDDPDVQCLDTKTGNSIWGYQTVGGDEGCGQGSLCVTDGAIFGQTVRGDIVRLSLDGKEVWRSPIGQWSGTGSPIAADGKIFASGVGGMLAALDANTGRRLWTYSTGTGYVYGSPTYWNGRIYVPSLDGSVTCVLDDIPE